MPPLLLRNDDTAIALLSTKGRFMVVDREELRVLSSGGRGTMLMTLDDDDSLAQWVAVGPRGIQLSGIYRRKESTEELDWSALEPYRAKRARKGRMLDSKIAEPTLSALRENLNSDK